MKGNGIDLRLVARTSLAKRREVVEQYRTSGLTQREFAQRRRMPLSTLTQWLGEARLDQKRFRLGPPADFHSFALAEKEKGWVAELARPDGTTVRFTAQTPVPLVEALLRASE